MNSNFNDGAKEQIRQRADIGAVVGRYVNLKGRGGTLMGLCPFHKEKTPSFQVNPSRGVYYCFGCGKGGDVFNFVQEIEGVDFREALQMLADETGVRLEKRQKDDRAAYSYYDTLPPSSEYSPSLGEPPPPSQNRAEKPISKKELLDIHSEAAKYYYNCIKNHTQAIDYFKSRGLTGETVKEFSLGYAPDGWSGLLDYLRGRNYTNSQIAASGLVIVKEGTGSVYDRFRDRVMFPLCDLSGRVIGFAGRGMNADAQPKYLNSPETALYKKSGVLYGMHKSRAAVRELGYLIIVEGYMDYLTLYQAGIRNAAAVSGTAFTTEHAQMITRFTQKVVLVFDGDRAGRSAAQRAVFVLAPVNIKVFVLMLPGDDDPDSFVKREGGGTFLKFAKSSLNADIFGKVKHEAGEAFLKFAKSSAKPAADFLIDKLVSESDGSPHAKSGVVDELIPYARALSDTIVRDDFLTKLALRLNIDRKRVLERFNNYKNYPSPYDDAPAPPANGFNVGITLGALEESFLRILITSPKLIIQAKQHIQPGMLADDLSANIYSIILEEYERDNNLGGLAEACSNNPAIGNAVSMLAVKPALTENIEDELVQKILLLHRKFLKTRMSELTESLKSCPEEEKGALLERLRDYGARLKELE